MPPELHLHPDRLRSHAATAAGLSEALRAVGPGPDLPAGGGPQAWDAARRAAEQERLRCVLRHAVRELAELSAALAGAAAAADAADRAAARAFTRARGSW